MPILQLTAEHAEAFAAKRLEALRLEPLAFVTAFEDEEHQPLAWFAAILERNAMFAALDDAGAMLGILGFRTDPSFKRRHVGYIWGMYVDAAQRGRGLGAALMSAAIAHARGRVAILHLAVGAANPAAIGLYENQGFTIYGTERGTLRLGDREFDSHLMARRLD